MWEKYKKYEPIFGAWYINGLIGEGSYGQVYEIERRDFGVYRSALKIVSIPRSQAEIEAARGEGMDDASLKSYYRSLVDEIVKEFSLMSKLKGTANVVSYEDHLVIPHDDGIGWDVLIRMELLTSLKDHLKDNLMTEQDIIRMGVHICRALELCGKHNIIHRDIKPENIFISPNGDYKLGDFGIARTVEATMEGLSKKGTFFYMAPEVYRGYAYGPAVDIYSLGMVMYFFLNNKRHPFMPPSPRPITFSDRENALRELMKGAPLPRTVHGSDQLWEIVRKACEYNSANRYSSPTEMREALEALLKKDASAAGRIVLGADNPASFGQYATGDDLSYLPDGPGTAVLDIVEGFGSEDETVAVSAADLSALKDPPKTPAPKPRDPAAYKPASHVRQREDTGDSVGGKFIAGVIFGAVVLVFLIFLLVTALSGKGKDKPDDVTPADEITDTENPDSEPEDETEDNEEPDEPETVYPEALILSASVLNMEVGGTDRISVSVSPDGAELGDVTWKSSDTDVVTVDEDGTVTAVGSGIAGITASADGLTATCTVNVQPEATVTGIEIESPPDKTEYLVGEVFDSDGLTVRINYSDGSHETMDSGFSFSDEPFSSPGIFRQTVTYSGFEAAFDITVTEAEQSE
ncbi:MAG: protein kinase [Oscillospiraceae bacterium]|nr:protein kinase [Oscillospiraceae bacterium]